MQRHAAASPILVVAGPTASGKSALAIELALALRGEVVNGDAVQLYRECSVASAKPSIEEMQGVPHHGFSVASLAQPIDAGRFADISRSTIDEIAARGQLPIVVGGSNLYLKALLLGLAPDSGADVNFRERCTAIETAELWAELKRRDPARASQLHPNDRVRLIRALEISASREGGASATYAAHQFATVIQPALVIVIWPDRALLRQRIRERTERMVRHGVFDEARQLIKLGVADSRVLDAIGYREALQCVRGEIGESQFIELVTQRTARFAKQQLTFWRNEPSKRGWLVCEVVNPSCSSEVIEDVRERLCKPLNGVEVWPISWPLAGRSG